MKFIATLTIILFLLWQYAALGQEPESPSSITLEKIEVQDSFQLKPAKIISHPTYALYNLPTNADMLEHSGELFVQRSQLGGGSPVIRGFEANRI
ncbi:MAG: hypothetical protein RML72_12650, partial [Bacteroidia bacterium]|nr:hypothetical protein [Bacteroidia bacterium]